MILRAIRWKSRIWPIASPRCAGACSPSSRNGLPNCPDERAAKRRATTERDDSPTMKAASRLATPAPPLDGMRFIEGGSFTRGSDRFYPEERPLRRVKVDGFWIDETPVTNAAFAEFVAATGYRTLAELPPDPKLYPGADLDGVEPGSLLFQKADGLIPLDRSEEHTSELQSLMRISYAVFCLKKKKKNQHRK